MVSATMNVAWALVSLPLMFRTCPFLIIAIASYPASVRRAVQKLPKPRPERVGRLKFRWSRSTILFRYFACPAETGARVRLPSSSPQWLCDRPRSCPRRWCASSPCAAASTPCGRTASPPQRRAWPTTESQVESNVAESPLRFRYGFSQPFHVLLQRRHGVRTLDPFPFE
jgi:hypothetical protein